MKYAVKNVYWTLILHQMNKKRKQHTKKHVRCSVRMGPVSHMQEQHNYAKRKLWKSYRILVLLQ